MAVFGNLIVDQFVRTDIAVTIVAASNTTQVVVTDPTGFPVPQGLQYFYLTLVDNNNLAEVVTIESVSGNTFTLAAGTAVQGGFTAGQSRAELWLTAEAFEDMQDYILSIPGGGGGGYEPDNVTIQLDGLNQLEVLEIDTQHLADGAVETDKLETYTGAGTGVTNVKLAPGIDAVKLIGANRTVVQESVERTGLPNTAGLTMLHIAYEEVSSAPTSGGSDGDIAIEWEAL